MTRPIPIRLATIDGIPTRVFSHAHNAILLFGITLQVTRLQLEQWLLWNPPAKSKGLLTFLHLVLKDIQGDDGEFWLQRL